VISGTLELDKLPPGKSRGELAAKASHQNDFLNFRLEPFN